MPDAIAAALELKESAIPEHWDFGAVRGTDEVAKFRMTEISPDDEEGSEYTVTITRTRIGG